MNDVIAVLEQGFWALPPASTLGAPPCFYGRGGVIDLSCGSTISTKWLPRRQNAAPREDRRSSPLPVHTPKIQHSKCTREGVDGMWAVLSPVVVTILLFYCRSENHSLKLARIC
jgi:hypothetical protein